MLSQRQIYPENLSWRKPERKTPYGRARGGSLVQKSLVYHRERTEEEDRLNRPRGSHPVDPGCRNGTGSSDTQTSDWSQPSSHATVAGGCIGGGGIHVRDVNVRDIQVMM